ncbi:MAG TPA: Ig-like domain-containing protein [Bacillota bacterium]|nr:Ig-like domain-containing protein [Bacillota bacterium]
MHWRHRLAHVALAGLLGAALAVTATAGPVAAAELPVIQAVSITGSASSPTITIDGFAFGSIPANTGQPVPFTGLDYGSQLGISDLSANWNAGQTGNGVGITVSAYSDTEVQFGLGSYYQAGGFSLSSGDSFRVLVKGVTCTGTVGYPATITCAAPVISTVQIGGSLGSPSITINGAGFGSIPANTGQPVPFTGLDYGNQLGISNLSANWNAGQTGNGVGITVSSYTNTQIVFGLGSYYSAGGFGLYPGDTFRVLVKGITCAGTVGYPATVACAPTSTTLAPSSNTVTAGQPVSLTATVTGDAPGTGGPTGNVTLYEGSTALTSASLDPNEQAVLAVSSLAAGTHTLKAVYAGDGVFRGSTSATVSVTVTAAPTSTTLTAVPNPSVYGQSVGLTATVSSSDGTPSGTVTFYDGATSLGSATLNGGTATLSTSSLSVATHKLTAVYAGDTDFATSTSPAVSQVVNPAATTITLTAPASVTYGNSLTMSAQVSAAPPGTGVPSGLVTFYDGTAPLGSFMVTGSGTAVLTVIPAVAGVTHTLTAVYAGSTDYAGSTSTPATVQVQPAPSSTAVASSPNPSVYGQPVTLTATVTSAAGPSSPTGSVTFYDGSTSLGTGTLSGDKATLTTSDLGAGAHSITAVYGGDADFAASTSTAVSQTVSPDSTTTTLASGANPSVFGQPVTLTVSVAVSPPGAGAPTGTVTFTDGSATLGSATLSGGTATFTTSSLSVGSHAITATYAGDANFTGGTSGSLAQVVNQAATGTTLSSSADPSVYGQGITLTATVAVTAPGAGSPSGSVTFYDGSTSLGTAPLSAGAATYTTSSLAVGSHALSAVFSGDTSFLGSTGDLAQTVSQAATTLTLTSQAVTPAACNPAEAKGHDGKGDCDPDHGPGGPLGLLTPGDHGTVSGSVYLPTGPDTSALGQPVTFTATVTVTAPGAGTPTGSVTFADGATTLGTAALSTTNGTTAATLTTSKLPAGPQTITATYGGDTDFTGSSASLTQRVQYVFVGLLPPGDHHRTVDPNETLPITFHLLDAHGQPVRGATATLLVNGSPAVPQGRANDGDQFREQNGLYVYLLKLRDQGVTSGSVTLTIDLSDGTTHTFTLDVVTPRDHH